MRIPPGLLPKLVTSTRDAAAAGGDKAIPPTARTRAPARAMTAVLVRLTTTSINIDSSEFRHQRDDRQSIAQHHVTLGDLSCAGDDHVRPGAGRIRRGGTSAD